MTGSFANTIDLSLWYIFILQVHKCINIYSLHRIINLTSSVLSPSHCSGMLQSSMSGYWGPDTQPSSQSRLSQVSQL